MAISWRPVYWTHWSHVYGNISDIYGTSRCLINDGNNRQTVTNTNAFHSKRTTAITLSWYTAFYMTHTHANQHTHILILPITQASTNNNCWTSASYNGKAVRIHCNIRWKVSATVADMWTFANNAPLILMNRILQSSADVWLKWWNIWWTIHAKDPGVEVVHVHPRYLGYMYTTVISNFCHPYHDWWPLLCYTQPQKLTTFIPLLFSPPST